MEAGGQGPKASPTPQTKITKHIERPGEGGAWLVVANFSGQKSFVPVAVPGCPVTAVLCISSKMLVVQRRDKQSTGEGPAQNWVTQGKLLSLVFTSKELFSFSLSSWSTDLWKNRDESWNFPQGYDPEMIKEVKRKEVESEIRMQVKPH